MKPLFLIANRTGAEHLDDITKPFNIQVMDARTRGKYMVDVGWEEPPFVLEGITISQTVLDAVRLLKPKTAEMVNEKGEGISEDDWMRYRLERRKRSQDALEWLAGYRGKNQLLPLETTGDTDKGFAEAEGRIQEAQETRSVKLCLNGLGLTSLPVTLFQLYQIEELQLAYNELTTLPECISELYNLTYLDISNNELIALPKSIGSLPTLQILDIGENHLESLGESLGNLGNLQSLIADGNRLHSSPDSVRQLKNLLFLDIDYD